MLLRELLKYVERLTFASKPEFVDPRPSVSALPYASRLDFVDCTNRRTEAFRGAVCHLRSSHIERIYGAVNAHTYHRRIVSALKAVDADIDLWLGDWARGRGSRPVVSFVQGPPGTDARSIFTRRQLLERLCGRWAWQTFAAAARWRLGPGLPPFRHSDHVIVGSEWSRRKLIECYGFRSEATHALPYPIDLCSFRPSSRPREASGRLRVLWLGRFAPRKRLDVFLDGLALAIKDGVDAEAWVVGQSAFAAGFEKLLHEFPFRDRLRHWPSVPRSEVPEMLAQVDVLAQPSDEENFGASVAEALACGVPAIVGATNGTADYICERSVRLRDDSPSTFASALADVALAKRNGVLTDRSPSRNAAERHFDPAALVIRLMSVLDAAMKK
ncbi:MAG: glycosyltransferase family 4 protein [Lacipirellulaceae bacterium]